ncbi:MAG: acyltransferase [Micromonosporaceae bacterium]|nr:acyltransferase [Micromonosporaceae bacterium]
MEAETATRPPPSTVDGGVARPDRVVGLDGVRGLAALYVMLFHCWLRGFHSFPYDSGPIWLAWLLYGHLAVVVFITLSGFSLGISPARHDWQLGGLGRYARRRAWRILPPYWAALAFSLLIAWAVTPQPHSGPPNLRTVAVYGLLLQDNVVARTPNGAMWSIAVEAELYLLLPLLLLLRRRIRAIALVAAVMIPVVLYGLLGPQASPENRLTGLTPLFAAPFAIGLVAAGVLAAGARTRGWPWHWLAVLTAAPTVALMLIYRSQWTVAHYYWIDLALAPAIAMMLAALATGRPAPAMWLLGTRPLRSLGSFSYSLYLIHLPIVIVVSRYVVGGRVPGGRIEFLATAGVAVPVSLLAARLFAAVFEIPFQRYRGWAQLRRAYLAWRSRLAQRMGRAQRADPVPSLDPSDP